MRTYLWADPSVSANADTPDDACATMRLWDRLLLDDAVVVLERIPDDLPPSVLTSNIMEQLSRTSVRSAVVMPVAIGLERTCTLAVETLRADHTWPAPLVERLRLFA